MKRVSLFFLLIILLVPFAQAQNYFNENKEDFFRQALVNLRMLGTEPAKKVAFDFSNAWTAQFTSAQQDSIHSIALQMQQKGYTFKPYFWYYFSYLAYATSQSELTSADLSIVLEINSKMVKTMPKQAYGNFLLGLNTFMARRILGMSKNVTTITDKGTFEFKLLDEPILVAEDEPATDEPAPIEDTYQEPATDDPWGDDNAGDPWSNDSANDPWANDPWANDSADDRWADQNDGSSYDDNWVESENVWGYDKSGDLFREKEARQFVETIEQDYVAGLQSRYIHPEITGPVINLENNSMVIVTPYDSLKFKETDGSFLLHDRTYAGDNAVINWPADNYLARGAVVNLGQFFILADRSDFWTPNAKLTFPSLFSGTVDGYFEYRSKRRKPDQLSGFPVFISNHANIDLKLGNKKVKYHGGIEIRGNRFAGTAVSKKDGTLQILDGKGNTIVFRAEKFIFHPDSTITSQEASIAIKHGMDSIFHPSVQMTYDPIAERLVVLRTKSYNITSYSSTFFKMSFNADLIKWNLSNGVVNFSILNGKDLIPMTVESDDFFNAARYSRLSSGFRFHPVSTSVYYANKYGTREFADAELVAEFDISIKEAQGAMRVLEKYDFASYNQETGVVRLKDKAFLFYDAAGGKVDYDNLLIPSLSPNQENATWLPDSGHVTIRGVDRFYLTSDFKVYAEPDEQTVRLEKSRNLTFDGMVNAGDFQYKGKNFQFDYDEFLINLRQIDSIRIQIDIPDSLREEGGPRKQPLNNHLSQTTGTLYLDQPDNKSAARPSPAYPDFVSHGDAIVYFDGPDVLDGAYDKSVKFVIPPFKTDSLDSEKSISFDGYFNSGGIFPTFDETLHLMPDQSLGFVHQIPQEGYNLYGTAARTYEKITLSSQGLRGGGKIDFITSTIYSNDFIYYPDSVAAVGMKGSIGAGEVNGASYPQAVLGPYRMHWFPRIDSMYLRNLREPFAFYNATATLDGAIDITSRGVFGSGKMLTRGSRAISDNMTFEQFSYSARHAAFEVLTHDPEKPAMAGDDIRLHFDLTRNIADIQPENIGVAAISFPYAQMKTSITNAVWYLEDSVVTMTKPQNVPIEDSYFYTTRKELDSLVFNARQAVYDLNTRELNIKGIPYIVVADAKIIPGGNETTILENAELQPFSNAQIIMDTLNEYHYLYNGEIKILSRNAFAGSAMYQLISGADTFAIKFESFDLRDVNVNGKTKRMTVSGGEIPARDSLIIAPGFYYKGHVEMFSYKKALELNGAVQLMLQDPGYNYWVQYQRTDDSTDVRIDFENAYFEDEEPVVAGLHYDLRGELYTSFVAKRRSPSDEDFFAPKGMLTYDADDLSYSIEKPSKTRGESYDGYTMIYNDNTKSVIFEGPAQFLSPFNEDITVKAAIMGSGNLETHEYSANTFMIFDFPKANSFMDIMAFEMNDIIERLGPPLANDISIEMLYKLANITSDQVARTYEASSLKEYHPLYTFSKSLEKSLVISGVNMEWSHTHKAWYNTTKLAISHIYDRDVNAKLDGFIEIRKDESGADVLNMFIQAAPETWYYISYSNSTLVMYSSSGAFNDEVDANSNYGKARPGELVLVGGDENETLSFINAFREKYFGITDPYNLSYPDELSLEDETFETIEEKEEEEVLEDDGFGF